MKKEKKLFKLVSETMTLLVIITALLFLIKHLLANW